MAAIVVALWLAGLAALLVFLWRVVTLQENEQRKRAKLPDPPKGTLGDWAKTILYIVAGLLLLASLPLQRNSPDEDDKIYHAD